jgi:hypothetical protein
MSIEMNIDDETIAVKGMNAKKTAWIEEGR